MNTLGRFKLMICGLHRPLSYDDIQPSRLIQIFLKKHVDRQLVTKFHKKYKSSCSEVP